MERVIAQSLRREIDRQESGEELLVFLTITHPTMDEIIRVVTDPENFTYGGEEYIGFLFDIEFLSDSDRFPETRLVIQNVDERIGKAIKDLIDPPRVKIEAIPLSEFDTSVIPRVPLGTPEVAYLADKLFLIDVEIDALQVSGRLVNWNYSQEVWPGTRATQNRCPGLFR